LEADEAELVAQPNRVHIPEALAREELLHRFSAAKKRAEVNLDKVGRLRGRPCVTGRAVDVVAGRGTEISLLVTHRTESHKKWTVLQSSQQKSLDGFEINQSNLFNSVPLVDRIEQKTRPAKLSGVDLLDPIQNR
jgi:hypothetical protein